MAASPPRPGSARGSRQRSASVVMLYGRLATTTVLPVPPPAPPVHAAFLVAKDAPGSTPLSTTPAVDLGVYTRNRAWRVAGSAKAGDAERRVLGEARLAERALRLCGWRDLHRLVCGEDEIDLEVLKRNTDYDSRGFYSWEHANIRAFWDVLASFSPEQKRNFVRCVCAGTTCGMVCV